MGLLSAVKQREVKHLKLKPQVNSLVRLRNAKVVSSPNKKIHTITYTRPTLENGKYMMNCWTFDRRDPIGKYVLTVKIGKHEFEKQVFHVTE